MARITRRSFLLSSAALSVDGLGLGAVANGHIGIEAQVRLPMVGQSWRYAKHDRIAGTLIDTEVNRLSAVGRLIEISTQSETPGGKLRNYPSWGVRWLEKYGTPDRPAGPRPSEIQGPWGMVWVDPHWSEIQAYEKPMPLWPMELRPGWSSGARYTQYQTDNEDPLPWQLTMHSHAWESITVPAGHFDALRYTNLIDFRFSNVSEREAAQRQESIWFAPDIGRWVARESFGSFREAVGTDVQESSYRWELLSWT